MPNSTKVKLRKPLEYPTLGTWRRCSKCHRKIMILKSEFWKINGKEYYHIKCKDIVRFSK